MRICVSILETNTSNSVHVLTVSFMLITLLIKITDLSLGHLTVSNNVLFWSSMAPSGMIVHVCTIIMVLIQLFWESQ